jgi:2-alkyl-3-oxoalkanoate reductase
MNKKRSELTIVLNVSMMVEIMRHLVTGGTGFLGGHLVAGLLARGDEVVAMGRDAGRCAALERAGASVVRCELSDQSAVSTAMARAQVVFHVAGMSAPWGPYREFYESNVSATENVLKAALHHGVNRFVLVSSPSVTFDQRDETESDETKPYVRRFLSPYQATKKMAEDVVNAARNQMECVILRPKAMFGPGDRSLMPRLIKAARAGRLQQIGAGTNLVDLTYVGNAVDALLLAATSVAAPGKTYLITNGEHVPLWPLLRRMLAAAGCEAHLRKVPQAVAHGVAALMEWKARRTESEPLFTRYAVALLARSQTYSIAAARRDLGYVPRVSVNDGIALTLPWLHELRRFA